MLVSRSDAGQCLSLCDNVMPAGLGLWKFLSPNAQLWSWPVIWWGHPMQVWDQLRGQSATFCWKSDIFRLSAWVTLLWSLWEICRVGSEELANLHICVSWWDGDSVIWRPTCSTEIILSRYCWSGGEPWHSNLLLFALQTTQQTFGSHTFHKRVSQNPKQSSICWNIKAGSTPTSTPRAHIPCTHSILQHSGCVSLLWVFHPGWMESTCATCERQLDELEAIWQDFPQSVSSSTIVISSQR